ncbi:MAG: F-type H+-transporting ATPase subunit delta [Chloroflexi bacterium]|jgi:F-type H+-transporting ATPase subunit delta|nr:MAG: F-type H+-transporting ATPase subunit delta [Chloroflexota bacterium]
MARTPLAKRYAQAVFAIALEDGALEEWRVELVRSAECLADDQTKVFLQSPKVNFQRKLELLHAALSDVRENVSNLVGLIVKNGALQILDGVVLEYQKLLDDLQGREQVEITTAIELEEEQKSRLQKQLKDLFGKEIVLNTNVSQDILGGILIRVGDMIIDGTVRERLTILKQRVLATPS